MSTLDDLRTFLVSNALANDGDVFLGVEPDSTTDPCVTLKVRPGQVGAAAHDQIPPIIEYPYVLVNCRDRSYQAAQERAQTLYSALFTGGQTLNGRYYYTFRPMQLPFELGPPDVKDRRQVGFILRMQRSN